MPQKLGDIDNAAENMKNTEKKDGTAAVSQNETADAVPKAISADKKEIQYGILELANAARSKFNATPEVVMAALKTAGKNKATFTEAQTIIKEFMERSVK